MNTSSSGSTNATLGRTKEDADGGDAYSNNSYAKKDQELLGSTFEDIYNRRKYTRYHFLPSESSTYEYEHSEARMRRKSDIALYKKIEANRAVG
jgi:hypothetical protein